MDIDVNISIPECIFCLISKTIKNYKILLIYIAMLDR